MFDDAIGDEHRDIVGFTAGVAEPDGDREVEDFPLLLELHGDRAQSRRARSASLSRRAMLAARLAPAPCDVWQRRQRRTAPPAVGPAPDTVCETTICGTPEFMIHRSKKRSSGFPYSASNAFFTLSVPTFEKRESR